MILSRSSESICPMSIKRIIGKISNWLIERERTKGFFFFEDVDGKLLFYPWGKPGEAYIVSNKVIGNLSAISLLISLLIASILSFILYLVFTDRINPDYLIISLHSSLLLIFFIHCAIVLYIHKNYPAFLIPLAERESRKIRNWHIYFFYFISFLGIAVFSISAILISPDIYVPPLDALYVIFLVGVAIWLRLLKNTKGYILNK